jgi:triacylglycerol lipase
MAAGPDASKNPVVLIHGIDDTCIIFTMLTSYLTRLGWSVYSLDLLPSNGDVGLDRLAQQVQQFVEATFPPEQPIDLLGFSMGGIVSRYYVQRLGGIDRVQRLVTVASPHHGTITAYLRPNLGGNQMQPNSALLWDLNQDAAMLEQINFTSIWTPLDLMIVPARSSEMPVGRNCVVKVANHAWMVTDSRSLTAIADALAEPLRSRNDYPELGSAAGHASLRQECLDSF